MEIVALRNVISGGHNLLRLLVAESALELRDDLSPSWEAL
jgi:hypothetical protein